MDVRTVNRLAAHLPTPEQDRMAANPVFDGTPFRDEDMRRFLCSYKDLAFGWHATRSIAVNGLDLPFIPEPKDRWLLKSWLWHRGGEPDPALTIARALHWDGLNGRAPIIRAMLISNDFSEKRMREVCGDGAVTPEAIEAYEKLFFNVRDRREDALYVSQFVYPFTRLVEVFDGYMRNEGLGMLLLRIGYNGTLKDVAYWAGLSNQLADELVGSGVNSELALRLEGHILAFGMLMAKYGFVHQRANANALSAARGLIAAGKQAGIQTEEAGLISLSMGDALRGEIKEAKTHESLMAMERFEAALAKSEGRDGGQPVLIDV